MQKRKRTAGWGRVTTCNAVHTLGLAVILVLLAAPCLAQEQADEESSTEPGAWKVDHWYIYTSLYTRHFDPQPEHVNKQKMLGIEAQMTNNWVFGFSTFDNSFGQRSEYLYAGYRWALFHSPYWYFKLTGGLLYGYKDEYKDKIPYNDLGIAPAAIPTLGFHYKSFVMELNLAGNAAINVTAGFSF